MVKADAMMDTVENIVKKHFGCSADEIRKIENATNNFVYSFTAAGESFFLKLYRNKDWPETGKIPFVYRNLLQKSIPCAQQIAYNRDNEVYPNGYLIEREIQGTAADKIQLSREEEIRLYAQMAELVSSVHDIRIHRFGYIGSGIADCDRFTDFLEDEFDGLGSRLKDAVSETQLKTLKEKVLDIIHDYEDLPSVLCHGDLSTKNVIIRNDGEISLIDWDDAMALNWMADVSRLTFWMKQNYSEQEYILCRDIFLEHYRTIYRKDQFDTFENAYHIYVALDFLAFSIKVGNQEMESRLKNYLDSFSMR